MSIERKLAAIMFTDIAGYTALSAKDETKALKLLDIQKKILTPIIEEFNGFLHKEIGDGLLFTFPTVTEAVKCGIKIQSKTKTNNDLNLRIGIHEGEITLKDGDALGDDVNVASRIEAFSPRGGIAISNKVQQNISSLPEFQTSYFGKPELKGVNQNVEIYCIISHELTKPKNIYKNSKKSKYYKEILLSTLFSSIIIAYLPDFFDSSTLSFLQSSLGRSKKIKNPVTGGLQSTIHSTAILKNLALIDSLLKNNTLSDNLEAFTIADLLINEDATQGDFYSLRGRSFLQRSILQNNNNEFIEQASIDLNKAIISNNINIDFIANAYLALSDIHLLNNNLTDAEFAIKRALRANRKIMGGLNRMRNINKIKLTPMEKL